MPCTLSCGMPSARATPSRAKCGFCEPVHSVAPSSRASTTAQAGPILACDWNGHSYSASTTPATNMVVERGHLGKGRRGLQPGEVQPLGRLHHVPFALGDDADEPLVPDHSDARNVADRVLVDG